MTFAEVRRAFRWEDVTRTLDWDSTRRLNMAHEGCDRWARDRGRVALVWAGARGETRIFTYFDLARLASRLANVLAENGVRRGDRVAALMPRVPEAYVASLAVWKLGAVLVPLLGVFSSFAPFRIGVAFEFFAAAAAILCFVGGPLRMLFAALFEEGAPPRQFVMPTSYAPPAIPPPPVRLSALPPAAATPPVGWRARPQTAEIVQPPSVTDHTTRLLEKSEPDTD